MENFVNYLGWLYADFPNYYDYLIAFGLLLASALSFGVMVKSAMQLRRVS